MLGPVDSAVSVPPTEVDDDTPAQDRPPALYNVKRAEGAIAPGEYGHVVTLGLYERVNVDASRGSIYPGDLLVKSPTPRYATASDGPAVGTVIPLESGEGRNRPSSFASSWVSAGRKGRKGGRTQAR